MQVKGIIFEDFVNYKLPSMYIAFPNCDFKCEKDCGRRICQNSALVLEENINIEKEEIIERYLQNPISQAIICAGLEPLDSIIDLISFIDCFRREYKCNDPIVIYTGYTEEELESGKWGNLPKELQKDYWEALKKYKVIVKFGRYQPDQPKHFDNILGVDLASPNQYAKEYSNEC